MVFAPGLGEGTERYGLVDLITSCFLIVVYFLAGFVGSMLNSYDKFAIPALLRF